MTATELPHPSATRGDPGAPLRRFLALDAGVTAANGLVYLVASGPLGRLLGVDGGLLLGLGVFLAVFGAVVGLLAARPRPPVRAVQVVIEVNVVWAVLSIVALALWLDAPSTAGQIWIPLQAITVGGFAALQHAALRRLRG